MTNNFPPVIEALPKIAKAAEAHPDITRVMWRHANVRVEVPIPPIPRVDERPHDRDHHLRHRAHTGGERDPDLSRVRPFPTTKRSLARKFARDLLGCTALERAFGLLMMDLGYLEYSVSSNVKWTSRDGTGDGQRESGSCSAPAASS